MSELLRSGAADLAARIATGEVSAREVARAHLDRIDAVDDGVRAFLHVDAERALAAADAVDARRAAGDRLGPLAGVPLAVKDIFCMTGVPTTAGSRILEGWRPPYDSTVVRRVRDSGVEKAICFGHGHASRVLALCWLDFPLIFGQAFPVETASVSILGREKESWAVLRWNS